MAKKSIIEIEREVTNFLQENDIQPDVDGRIVTISFTREERTIKRVRAIDRPTYENCQAKNEAYIPCKGSRCVAHIITRQYHALNASNDNKLFICKAHEQYFNSRPIQVWFHFVKENYLEKFQRVRQRYEFVIKEFNLFMEVYNER